MATAVRVLPEKINKLTVLKHHHQRIYNTHTYAVEFLNGMYLISLSKSIIPSFTIDIGRCGVSANETSLHPNNNL